MRFKTTISLFSILFILSYSFGQVPNYVPTNGLVGWWPFNGNANDESGNGNNGTVNGATLTNDRFGNPNSAYEFNNDNIDVGKDNSLTNLSSFTISLWVKIDNPKGHGHGLFGSNHNDRSYLLNISSVDNFQFPLTSASSSSWEGFAQSNAQVSDGVWHHLVAVYSPGLVKIYIDIIDETNVYNSIPNNIRLTNSNIIIGTWKNAPNYYLDGKLDDIGIWNRALTPCEISALYHGQQLSAPVISFSDTTAACGSTTTLDAGTDPSYASYLWNTSDISQTLLVTSSGEYSVQVTDTNGCVGYDTTYVSLIDPTIDQVDTTICLGDSLVLSVPSATGTSCSNLPPNLQNGLVGYWPFCGNANDESGNGNDGTVNGATLTTDRFGNANSAYDFDGVDDYIESFPSNSIDYSLGLTLSAWVLIDGQNNNSNSQFIISRGWDQNDGHYKLYWHDNNNCISGDVNGLSTPFHGLIGSNNIPFSNWVNAVFVYDFIELKTYINGQLVSSASYSATLPQINSSLYFGRHHKPSSYSSTARYDFNGKLDDVGIWNRALTECEIQQLYYGGNSVLWSTGETCPSITVHPTTTTTYSVTVSDGISSCTDDVTVNVGNVAVDLGQDTLSACGSTTTLDAGTDSSYSDYLWNTSDITQTLAVTSSGEYSVQVTDTNGCVGYDTTYVSLIDPTIDQVDTTICLGDSLVLSVPSATGNSCTNLPSNLQNGLVGYWPFCGNANDESGNGNNGTVNGATLTTDRFGNANSAYDFDGVNDWVDYNNPTDLKITSAMSYSVWINTNGMTNWMGVMGRGEGTGGAKRSSMLMISSDYEIVFELFDGTNVNQIKTNKNIIADQNWYHIVATWCGSIDNNGINIYLNGQLVISQPSTINTINNSISDNDNRFKIGVRDNLTSGSLYGYFKGKIDDAEVYNRELNIQEIQDLYQSGSNNYTWSTGETTSSITVHPTTTTTYSVTVSDGISSCTDNVTVNVGNVAVDLGQDTLSACGATTTLDAGTDPSYSDYLWSTSDISQTLDITSSGEYSVQVTDTNGCVGYDTTYVSLIDPTIDQVDTTICLGDSLVLSVPSATGNSCSNLPPNLQNGLVGYWPFCGNANDESGNGNDGTVNGATLTSDRFGNANSAYSFDGVNDDIVVSRNHINSFTISVWVKLNSSSCFSSLVDSYDKTWEFLTDCNGGTNLSLAVWTGLASPQYYIYSSGYNLQIQEWTHVLCVFDSSNNASIYVNGNYVTSFTTINIPSSNGDFYFGRSKSGTDQFLNGVLDDVVIWNRTLSISEIQEVYSFGKFEYNWSTGDITSTITVQPTTTTTYSVTVSDGVSSCNDDVTITVNNPQIEAGQDTDVCNGDNITLNGNGGNTYTWTGGITDGVSFMPSSSGYYYVTGTDTDGCEGTDSVYVTVKQPTTGVDIQTACDTYTWIDGNTYTSSTNTPTFVLTNAQGCDSTVTLDLTITSSNAGIETIVECSSYTWPTDGQTYTQSGQYTAILTNAQGCDSTVTLDLTINQPTTGVDVQTACDTYTWIDGNTYTSSTNTPTFVLTNAQGCDSTVTLNLTITSSNTGIETIVECSSYTWPTDGQTYTQSGQYTAILTNQNGCDSTVTLDLTINQPTTGVDIQTACDTYTWIDGNTYTSSTNTPTFVLTNAQGCDSTVTLDLTITNSNATTESVTECSSYTWSADGQTYTQSGQYTAVLTNAQGCDSTVTLDLTINQPTTGVDVQTACDTYTWIDGNTYTSSTNIPTYVLTNALGCDSVVTLDLTINNFTNLSYTIPSLICEGDSIRLLANGGVDYQWDNGVTNGAFVKPTLGINTYQVQGTDNNGCIASATIQVEVVTNPEVTFITQPAKCQGYNDGLIEAVVINGQLPYSYDWDNGGTDYIISELRAGAYILTVTDANFCSVSEKVDLDEVDINCLNVSSGLSPNGDGINDVWVVNGLDIYPDAEIKVLNRWGAVVYSYQEDKQFWDGTFEGKDLPSADYYYIIKVPDTKIKMNGVISLKR